jgi:hypothetical protein
MNALKAFAELHEKYPEVLASKTPDVRRLIWVIRAFGIARWLAPRPHARWQQVFAA